MRTFVEKKRIFGILVLGLIAMMAIGSQVIAGRRHRSRRHHRRSTRVHYSDIKGIVSSFDSVNPDIFYILNDLVAIDGSNAKVSGTANSLNEIWEGDEVEVKGTFDATAGAIIAVKIEDKGQSKDGELEGNLEAVDPLNGTVTLFGQEILVDGDTLIEGHHGMPLSLQDLSQGQRVKIDVIVEFDSNGDPIDLYAVKIEADGDNHNGDSHSGDNHNGDNNDGDNHD